MRKTRKVIFAILLGSLAVLLSTYTLSNYQREFYVAPKKNLDKPMPATKHLASIVLGAGCFWGAEKSYQTIPGVVDAISGYADGVGVKPTYRDITRRRNRNNPNNHAEVVKVTYNTSQIDLEVILRKYFETHDPTQLNRQGNDIGTQYRSTILYNNKEQARKIYAVRNQYQSRLTAKGYGKIVTKIKPLTAFFSAEEYHQDYLVKNPNGYCPDHSTGVTFADKPNMPVVDNSAISKGQQIVVIDSPDCPYCEKFKKDVVSKYNKSTPITFRRASELKGLTVKTPTWATPTILFLKDGKELLGHQGYMNKAKFYAAHDKLKFK
jgi:peptide methionine sulfoxide reductase msrA/msrB